MSPISLIMFQTAETVLYKHKVFVRIPEWDCVPAIDFPDLCCTTTADARSSCT